mmetsp:Transcript_10290/g.29382  ORF Transcript_10290/g.29382 Transcript_10290/m.29382 type:complete len:269 (-) Transcript_10290:1506-2312(-)
MESGARGVPGHGGAGTTSIASRRFIRRHARSSRWKHRTRTRGPVRRMRSALWHATCRLGPRWSPESTSQLGEERRGLPSPSAARRWSTSCTSETSAPPTRRFLRRAGASTWPSRRREQSEINIFESSRPPESPTCSCCRATILGRCRSERRTGASRECQTARRPIPSCSRRQPSRRRTPTASIGATTRCSTMCPRVAMLLIPTAARGYWSTVGWSRPCTGRACASFSTSCTTTRSRAATMVAKVFWTSVCRAITIGVPRAAPMRTRHA